MTREEALNEIRSWAIPSEKGREVLETLIPELAESEDEKARKWIYDFIRNCPNESFEFYGGVGKQAVLAYLEKQKEQKPVEKQDYSGLNDLERAILRGFLAAGVENVPVGIIKETAQECLTNIKSAKWSDEDEKDMTHIIRILDDCYAYGRHDLSKTDHENLVNKLLVIKLLVIKLKSLRLQPKQEWNKEDEYRIRQIERIAQQAGCTQKLQEEIHDWLKSLRPSWKPKGQQLDCLRHMINVSTVGKIDKQLVQDLYEQLKTLM